MSVTEGVRAEMKCLTPIRTLRKQCRVLATSLLILMISLPVLAQTNTGRILGTVQDVTMGRLTGAKLTIIDVQRNVNRILTTDEAGDYVASQLPPGTYVVRAECKDLKTVERRNVELQVAMDARMDFTLEPGVTSETVTVNKQVPMVDTTNDVLGGTLSNNTVNELPLNGRDFENLVVLRPGVMRYPGGGIGSVSANGIRPEDNNYVVDGIDNNDSYFGQPVMNGSGVQGTPATILLIDAIQEFNVQQNSLAEYGWKPGAVINIGLKSGTNSTHGTNYYFGRNDVLDSRNFFNADPAPKKPLRMGQFGGTLGGPIAKQKAFFFLAYKACGNWWESHRRCRLPLRHPWFRSIPFLRIALSSGPEIARIAFRMRLLISERAEFR